MRIITDKEGRSLESRGGHSEFRLAPEQAVSVSARNVTALRILIGWLPACGFPSTNGTGSRCRGERLLVGLSQVLQVPIPNPPPERGLLSRLTGKLSAVRSDCTSLTLGNFLTDPRVHLTAALHFEGLLNRPTTR